MRVPSLDSSKPFVVETASYYRLVLLTQDIHRRFPSFLAPLHSSRTLPPRFRLAPSLIRGKEGFEYASLWLLNGEIRMRTTI